MPNPLNTGRLELVPKPLQRAGNLVIVIYVNLRLSQISYFASTTNPDTHRDKLGRFGQPSHHRAKKKGLELK